MLGREVLWLLAVADDVDGLRRRGLMTHFRPRRGCDLACHKTPGYWPRAGDLGAGGADEGRRVPAGVHRDLLHVHPGLRGVDDVAVAHVDGDVTDAVVVQQVTGLDGRGGD